MKEKAFERANFGSYLDAGFFMKPIEETFNRLASAINGKTEAVYPMFAGVEVVDLTHAAVPDECDFVWNEFFSHFSKDPAAKVLYYDGNVVDTPVNEVLPGGK